MWVRRVTDPRIPAVDGRRRADVRSAIASLIDLHHVVEVDPKPAFEELGLDPSQATFGALAAAAAGVLAGRLAVANRRWRAER